MQIKSNMHPVDDGQTEKKAKADAQMNLALAVATAAADIYRAGDMVDAVLQARHGLDTRLYTVLRLIHQGLCYPSQIADAMRLPRSVITRALHALAADRRIVRALDRDDTRRTRLALTAEGQATFEAATRSFGEWLVPKLKDLNEAELRGFFHAVAVLTNDDTPKRSD